jgi:Domain of unknown function (DUF4349)
VSPLELVDDRFGQLARALRASQPRASAELRERIETLAPPPSRRMRPSLRRLAPAVALVALAGSLCVAAAIGLVHSGSREHQVGASETSTAALVPGASVFGAHTEAGTSRSFPVPAWKLQARSGALAPARDRLQQYDAALTLRVHDADELSTRTQQAMRLVRSLGGFVVSASFDVPGRRGVSTLVLRVPIGQVQAAIADLSGYGTLLAQKISIQDLQQRADRQAARIAALRRAISAIAVRLRGPLSVSERARLEQQLAVNEQRLATMLKQRAGTVHRAELARISLTLVTPKPKAAAASSRLDRTLDDAGSVLARELQILLYALIVAGPLLLLGGLALVAARTQRSRSDRRLLERS